jgi:hypothetical protein
VGGPQVFTGSRSSPGWSATLAKCKGHHGTGAAPMVLYELSGLGGPTQWLLYFITTPTPTHTHIQGGLREV